MEYTYTQVPIVGYNEYLNSYKINNVKLLRIKRLISIIIFQ